MRLIPYHFSRWNCQVFINIKKYKIIFKVRKDYLRMAIYDSCFKQVHRYASMQDLENNNWIILDKLINIY